MLEFFPSIPKNANLLYDLIRGVGTILAGAIGAYSAIRFRNLATRSDAKFLKEQLEANTLLTREIEQRVSRSEYLMKRELEFRERQLSILYGPVYGYLKSQKQIFDLWMAGKLQDKNMNVKKLFRDQDEIIRNIIIENSHLIEGTSMPDYIVEFFTSSIIFDWYAASSEQGAVPDQLSKENGVAYPKKFDDHFVQTTERLRARIHALNAKFALSLDLPNDQLPR
ncbi:hypothetical protein [Methylobacterium sp. E-066]|uniref:hypothetical protein n=1 Tax=Methylobacterium sp. E-066 TaxID=2836584 RepID=UPI001FBA4A38|nr:hypothetical protein [Methylobacterium sp. E-066]MCJ2142538.1 hypothetical protein [Methylobacterium sp. E-066]